MQNNGKIAINECNDSANELVRSLKQARISGYKSKIRNWVLGLILIVLFTSSFTISGLYLLYGKVIERNFDLNFLWHIVWVLFIGSACFNCAKELLPSSIKKEKRKFLKTSKYLYLADIRTNSRNIEATKLENSGATSLEVKEDSADH